MKTTHQHRPPPRKQQKRAKKPTSREARPTAGGASPRARKTEETAPKRSWAYAEANAPTDEREDAGATRKTVAPTSVGRVYGGENNVTLPASEKSTDAASTGRVKKPARAKRSRDAEPARR